MGFGQTSSCQMKRAFFLCSLLIALCALTCAQRVRIGAEILLERHLDLLANKRVGVICNHTSILPNGVHLVDSLLKRGVNVTALFSPEHGIRGTNAAGKVVNDSVDFKTSLPIYSLMTGISVYSLYGKVHKPTATMLEGMDVLLFDLQDVGARFYTYASTMALAMEAAAEYKKKFIVLDRPNPINGIDIEGAVLDTSLKSFVGMFPIPIRHGLTLGELAKMIVGEKWIANYSDLDLTVITMTGWKRSMWYDETGLTWISPSPNMKTLSTATVYPGICLFEATNVSEGRGTSKPFEFIGAPWINADSIISGLKHLDLSGVQFEAIQFTPKGDSISGINPKYHGEECRGVYVHVTDRTSFHPVQTALYLLAEIRKRYPGNFQLRAPAFERLSGSQNIRLKLEQGLPLLDDNNFHESELEEYQAKIQNYRLY
jgi:uncharacterized protein YbbC (DUF1343 family)